MSKEILINDFNEVLDKFYDTKESEILEIINNEKSFVEIKTKENLENIINSEGFYIIFRNNYTKKICKYQKGEFVAVYRGHASKVRERIESHLFFNPDNRKLPSCMKVSIDKKRNVNINIETKSAYENRVKCDCEIPSCEWRVSYVALKNSKQGFRELFEKAFDTQYNRPEYSKK